MLVNSRETVQQALGTLLVTALAVCGSGCIEMNETCTQCKTFSAPKEN